MKITHEQNSKLSTQALILVERVVGVASDAYKGHLTYEQASKRLGDAQASLFKVESEDVEFRKGYDQAVDEITSHFAGAYTTPDSQLTVRDVLKALRGIWRNSSSDQR